MAQYSKFSENRKTALVRDEWRLELAAALLDGTGCAPAGKTGRGEVARFEFTGGTGIVRKCRRGGIIRHFIKDAYLFSNRPLRELMVHEYLYEQGFAVPEPLGVAWERRGLVFRGSIATREVEGVNLLDYLGGAPESPEFTLERTGKLIREMHDLGVVHADLQVRNILIGPVHPYIIDFDKAQRRTTVSHTQRVRNLLRLRRSFDKNFIPLRFFTLICHGYGLDSVPWLLDFLYDTKGVVSDAVAGRAGSHDPT
ncbi:MAG: hypothetical protein JXR94_23590 [Candidatus Hydrogenedentes bacterium]|nr:hypothetical protein [Candidatus Hydrogenedentota bacterium]